MNAGLATLLTYTAGSNAHLLVLRLELMAQVHGVVMNVGLATLLTYTPGSNAHLLVLRAEHWWRKAMVMRCMQGWRRC